MNLLSKAETRPIDLSPLVPQRKTGAEQFANGSATLLFTLLEFWQWSASYLVSNATRGRLAEFIVAKALDISTDGVRDEWQKYNLKIEVKSAAYCIRSELVSKALSTISFNVKKSLAWDRETNRQDKSPDAKLTFTCSRF